MNRVMSPTGKGKIRDKNRERREKRHRQEQEARRRAVAAALERKPIPGKLTDGRVVSTGRPGRSMTQAKAAAAGKAGAAARWGAAQAEPWDWPAKGCCCWPVTDGAPWGFCGAPAAAGSRAGYCDAHEGQAWRRGTAAASLSLPEYREHRRDQGLRFKVPGRPAL